MAGEQGANGRSREGDERKAIVFAFGGGTRELAQEFNRHHLYLTKSIIAVSLWASGRRLTLKTGSLARPAPLCRAFGLRPHRRLALVDISWILAASLVALTSSRSLESVAALSSACTRLLHSAKNFARRISSSLIKDSPVLAISQIELVFDFPPSVPLFITPNFQTLISPRRREPSRHPFLVTFPSRPLSPSRLLTLTSGTVPTRFYPAAVL
ncbi:hypothetical protein BCR35DRAFT_325685 [Leucosporidium creatinivorum]|uniref:Uncharacterized protein n=1 Tax=Leucosporidium creatinivorum TaxID=106004 RepID=A0A1Y2EXJ3_9BASI|nr:hypothetical protein BCR35DRAFT_325685 [Leucosporidium creatinivorum]